MRAAHYSTNKEYNYFTSTKQPIEHDDKTFAEEAVNANILSNSIVAHPPQVDVRRFQEHLDHKSVKMDLSYTHVLNRGLGVKSPLD